MIKGIGVDMLAFSRIEPLVNSRLKGFLMQFSDRELLELEQKQNPLKEYAKKFSAKEAVIKALKILDSRSSLPMIEVFDTDGGVRIELSGVPKETAQQLGVTEILVSYSDEDNHLVTFVVCQ